MKSFKATLLTTLISFFITPTLAYSEQPRHMVSAGWLHIENRSESDPLTTSSLRVDASHTDTGTEFSVGALDTVVITYSYAFTDNMSVVVLGGVPPEVELEGEGTSAMLGDLEAYGTLATAKQMSPTLIGQYRFGNPNQATRPFFGLGVTYTHLTDLELDSELEEAFIGSVKAQTLGLAEEVSVRVDADDVLSPVMLLGIESHLTGGWYAIGTVSYMPLETSTSVTTKITKSANEGLLPLGDFSQSETRIEVDPIMYFVGVGYRF